MRNDSRLFFLLFSVCFYLACSDAPPIVYTYTLTPGVGLEELKLGASGDEVRQVFGEPVLKTEDLGSTQRHYMEYFSEGLQFYFDPSTNTDVDLSLPITQIIASGKYAGRTNQGAIIGSSIEQIHILHGIPNFFDEDLNQDQYPGIHFCYDFENFVSRIKVQ